MIVITTIEGERFYLESNKNTNLLDLLNCRYLKCRCGIALDSKSCYINTKYIYLVNEI